MAKKCLVALTISTSDDSVNPMNRIVTSAKVQTYSTELIPASELKENLEQFFIDLIDYVDTHGTVPKMEFPTELLNADEEEEDK